MSVVTYEFRVGDYSVICIEPFPNKCFRSITIEGESYPVEPAYDLKNCIAIRTPSNHNFLGKEVEFK